MRFARRVAVSVGVVLLVVVAGASLTTAAAPAAVVHGTLDGHATPTPRPGPCLQNAAQCAGAGSIVAPGMLGTPLFVVAGSIVSAAVLARRIRRRRRLAGLLPDGRPLLIMRPPRSLLASA